MTSPVSSPFRPNRPLRLAVVDPALGSDGAHNAGFAALLGVSSPPGSEIGFWCHQSISEAKHAALLQNGGEFHPLFSTRFYSLSRRAGNVSQHWKWISRLAKEYASALIEILERWRSGEIAVIYHTLSWEHASALALAIESIGARGERLRHLAFLMYSPGAAPSGKTLHLRQRLNFRLAFNALARHANVKLYASCSEYAKAYAQILDYPNTLPLHPCFLGDWAVPPQKQRGRKGTRTILYLGEVKEDKGFDRLPELVHRLVKSVPEDRFIIQFIRAQSNVPERQAAIDRLASIGSQYPQLKVHIGFWSDDELRQELLAADRLYLPYNAAAYRHKTSGLLWLAAWYDVEVVVPQSSWLEREAKRLGIRYAIMDKNLDIVATYPSGQAANTYFNQIFTPFWAWFEAELHQ